MPILIVTERSRSNAGTRVGRVSSAGTRIGRVWRLVVIRLKRLLRRPSTRAVIRTALLLALFVALDRALHRATALPEAAYFEPVILLAWVRRLPMAVLVPGLALVGAAAVYALRRRTLGPRWDDFEWEKQLRMLVLLSALVLVWTFGAYPYNAYFDRLHLADRLLLPGLLMLTAWRPVFVLPLLVVLLPVMYQFNHPIGGFSAAQPILLVHILTLFAATVLLTAIRRRERWGTDFLFLACCLLAASFWVPGIGKLPMRWLAEDQIALLLPATYANGWLGFLSPETIERMTRTVAGANPLIKLITLVAEAGALLCLWRAATMRVFLVLWIILHVGIFVLTGIFFWMWIVVEAALYVLFFRRGARQPDLFSRHRFLTSIVVIAGGALWFAPENLAWRDVPVTYTYRIEAEGRSGRVYRLSPRYFAPYDYQFTLSNFHYLVDRPVLMVVWGATSDARLIRRIPELDTPGAVFQAEQRIGRSFRQGRRAARFDRFIQNTITVRNRRGSPRIARLMAGPPQLWTFPVLGPRIDEPIRRVAIRQITSLFDGREYRVIRDRPVRVIPIE